jgi:predicted kinase
LAIRQEETREHKMKKNFYILIGPPAVGKSTWIKKTFGNNQPFVISRDNIVDLVAEEIGVTYNEMFSSKEEKIKQANKRVDKIVSESIENAKFSGEDIVVDMTNLTLSRRISNSRAINGAEDKYKKVAVLFNFNNKDLLFKTAKKRSQLINASGKTKDISMGVLSSMINSFQEILPDENFEEILHVDTTEDLKKFIGE